MKNEKLFFISLIVFFIFVLSPQLVLAQSDYVLPYPSYMPGSKFYIVHRIWEEAIKYWYFGDFGQFTYNLNQSDKYLVEAKTLFEYKQYLLGYKALKKSDRFFSMIPFYLQKAKQEGKNTDQKKELLKQAVLKHIEVLTSMQYTVPQHFVWKPEKDSPTDLALRESIQNSISIRSKWIQL